MISKEPVITAAVVVALIEAIIIAAVQFGWDIAPDQQAALLGVVIAAAAVVTPLIGAVWARSKVTPVVAPQDDRGVPTGAVTANDTKTDGRGVN